jgi:hypothetical protein
MPAFLLGERAMTLADIHNDAIRKALKTGGVCLIGYGGTVIHYVNEWQGTSRLETWGDDVKAMCIIAGLPTIDITKVPIEKCYGISVRGPIVAMAPHELARITEHPGPFGYAKLDTVIEMWRAANAEIFNA